MPEGDVETYHSDGKWRNRIEGGAGLAGEHQTREAAVEAGGMGDQQRWSVPAEVVDGEGHPVGGRHGRGRSHRRILAGAAERSPTGPVVTPTGVDQSLPALLRLRRLHQKLISLMMA